MERSALTCSGLFDEYLVAEEVDPVGIEQSWRYLWSSAAKAELPEFAESSLSVLPEEVKTPRFSNEFISSQLTTRLDCRHGLPKLCAPLQPGSTSRSLPKHVVIVTLSRRGPEAPVLYCGVWRSPRAILDFATCST